MQKIGGIMGGRGSNSMDRLERGSRANTAATNSRKSSGKLTAAKKQELSTGIANHTTAENDRAQASMERTIEDYTRRWNNRNNTIFLESTGGREAGIKRIRDTLDSMTAQLNYFKKERKRQGR